MAISQQRMQELLAEYEELKKIIYEINHKYSMDVYEVDLGFPPTLGLQKLTYTPKTDEEMAELVSLQVEEKCAPKVASAEKALVNANASLQQQQLSAEESNRQKILQIDANYNQQTDDVWHKAVNANVQYSTLLSNALLALKTAYEEALNLQKLHYDSQNEAFKQKADANQQVYEQQMERIKELRQTLAQTIEENLRIKEEKQATAVTKYNNTVDEKENKYQFSCKRATQLAIQAEQSRALAAARLYASLGEVGFERRKKTDKYYACINFFGRFTKEEALFILNIDNFFQVELQDYYSTLVDWVNTYMS